MTIRVTLTSISVGDQDHALSVYRDILGFAVKHDIDMGNGARWLTLTAPDDPNGVELLLEPNADYPAMKAFKESLRKDGLPFTQLDVDDIDAEYERLITAGLTFTGPVQNMGPAKMAIFDDTCGNFIALVEPLSAPKTETAE